MHSFSVENTSVSIFRSWIGAFFSIKMIKPQGINNKLRTWSVIYMAYFTGKKPLKSILKRDKSKTFSSLFIKWKIIGMKCSEHIVKISLLSILWLVNGSQRASVRAKESEKVGSLPRAAAQGWDRVPRTAESLRWGSKCRISVSAGVVSSEPGVQMLSSCCVLTWPPPLQVCVLVSSSSKETSHTRSGPTLLTTCYPNHLFKDPSSKYSAVLGYWGLGYQPMNFGEDTIQPITRRKRHQEGKTNY